MTPRAFCQKCIALTFWKFSAWIWVKLAPIHSKRHLQLDSMPFFPQASCLTTFLVGHACTQIKLWSFGMRKWHTSLCFLIFFAFPFSPFLIFSLQWLTFYWVCFQLKNFWENITEMGNFYHGVVSEVTGNFVAFSCIFQAPLSWSLWSGYDWKDLLLLQNLSIDDANFGQTWSRQKWNKGQRSSQPVTGTGVNELTRNRTGNHIYYFIAQPRFCWYNVYVVGQNEIQVKMILTYSTAQK